jgi:O-antigen/teichoic acid export membrane protein
VLLAGLRLHYVEHAMHLAGRTEMIFLTAGIPAVLNVALNVVLLPRIGLDGAVLSTLAAYALALAICAVAAWRLFPLPVPAGAIVRSALAACVMGGVLLAFPSAPSALGLLALIGKGVGAYGVLALALDLAGVRGHVRRALGRPSTV